MRPWLEATLARLPAAKWCETLEPDELIMPIDLVRRMQAAGSQSSLEVRAALESLLLLYESGVLSEAAVEGFALRFLETTTHECLLKILCKHFDSEGLGDDFSRFVGVAVYKDSSYRG